MSPISTNLSFFVGAVSASKIYLGAQEAWSGSSYDADAAAYITAVENADGQALEEGVKSAINDFVVSLKNDGIWDTIAGSCILIGARTLNGALIPLKGATPTPYRFVDSDYDRLIGLRGLSSTNTSTGKVIRTNVDLSTLSSQFISISLWHETAGEENRYDFNSGTVGNSSLTQTTNALPYVYNRTLSTQYNLYFNNTTSVRIFNTRGHTGYKCFQRIDNSTVQVRSDSTTTNYTHEFVSNHPSGNLTIYGRYWGDFTSGNTQTFYSVGTAIDASVMQTRVDALVASIRAAIV